MNRYGKSIYKGKKPSENSFNPNRTEVQAAVEDFLKSGGKITKVELLKEMTDFRDWEAINDFLTGE